MADALFILFSGEENSSTNFNELVVLNALDFSFDPDVDPSDDQALAFTWFCKKSDEVCLHCFCIYCTQLKGRFSCREIKIASCCTAMCVILRIELIY